MSKTSSTTAKTTVIKASGTARNVAETTPGATGAALVTDSTLKDFFCEELKDIYWAENHITIALPKMIKAAGSAELQAAFTDHLKATATHISRLEQAFTILGKPVRGKKCDAIEGIVLEGESIIADTQPGTRTRDVGLILAAQKVEHYEIASYGGLAQLAKTLGLSEVAMLLEETLAEEKETDVLLTEIAENSINREAASE
jgi:ferritin-like metal-binding protein YciE